MVKKILFLLFCFGSSLQAVVVVVNVMPDDVLNWSNYASLGPTDVLEVVLSNPSGEVQLLAAGDMNMVTTVT